MIEGRGKYGGAASNELGRQSGQAIIIAVLSMGVLLGLMAMSIDVGLIFHERRAAQNAADAAALAGVAKLPPSGAEGEAESTALNWASKNGYEDGVNETTVTVNYPYQTDTSKLEVQVQRPVSFIFGKVLGLDITTVSARAVATAEAGIGGYAMYAHGSGCSKEIDWTGGTLHVIGDVHTNGQFYMSGTSNSVSGDVTHKAGCAPVPLNPATKSSTFGSGPSAAPFQDWPVQFEWDDFLPCTFSTPGDMTISTGNPTWWLNLSTRTLKPGVYCAGGKFNLSASDVNGNVTFIARDQVRLSGGGMNLTPYSNGVLLYAERVGGDAIVVSGSNGRWQGLLVAHHGEADVSGGGNQVLAGGVYAENIHLSGSNWSLDGSALGLGSPAIKLVE